MKQKTLERLLSEGFEDTGIRYGTGEGAYQLLKKNKGLLLYDPIKDTIYQGYVGKS